jgi:hypothetical protein
MNSKTTKAKLPLINPDQRFIDVQAVRELAAQKLAWQRRLLSLSESSRVS